MVLGRLVKATGEAVAVQLSAEHNAAIESVRKELHAMHPDDPRIVVLKHNVWRVKGLIQVLEVAGTRMFGIAIQVVRIFSLWLSKLEKNYQI